MTPLLALNRAVTSLERSFAGVSAGGVAVIMVVMVADVMGRYLFNQPLDWSYELISLYLFPLVFFFAVSDTFRRNHHLAVDIFYARLSLRAQRGLRLGGAVLSALVLAPVAWLAAVQAVRRFADDSVTGGSIPWPTWIPSAMAAAGIGLFLARLLLDAAALAAALLAASPEVPGESPERASEAAALGENTL